jgi:group I intron endonuclease
MYEYTRKELSRPGIYLITNEIGVKKYVGQSRNIFERWKQHKEGLRNNCHHNQYLQNSWNVHGETKFTFDVIEFCAEELLDEREQHWIETLKPEYNITKNIYKPRYEVSNAQFKKQFRRLTKEVIMKGRLMSKLTILPYNQMPVGMISKGYSLTSNDEIEDFALRLEEEKTTITTIYHNPKTKTVYIPKPVARAS